jgi:thioredoxin 1
MADPIHTLTSLSDLDALATSNKYVILDFTATWCPPCKAIAPLFHKLAAEHSVPGALAFGKVDVDDAAEVAAKFSISAMPTFLFLVDGDPSGIDAGDALADAGPSVVRVEGSGGDGPLVAIRGANPRALGEAIVKVAELAKGEVS